MHKNQTPHSYNEVISLDFHLDMKKPKGAPVYVRISGLFKDKGLKGILTFSSNNLTVVLLSIPKNTVGYY